MQKCKKDNKISLILIIKYSIKKKKNSLKESWRHFKSYSKENKWTKMQHKYKR